MLTERRSKPRDGTRQRNLFYDVPPPPAWSLDRWHWMTWDISRIGVFHMDEEPLCGVSDRWSHNNPVMSLDRGVGLTDDGAVLDNYLTRWRAKCVASDQAFDEAMR